MSDLTISGFEELEYDLSGLGLKGFFLSIEESFNYIYSDNFHVVIPDKTNIGRLVSKVDGKGNIIIPDGHGEILILTKEQYDEILKLINL